MGTAKYLELIKKYQAPSRDEIERFIWKLSNEHSWYKHLSDERDNTFFFYLLPPTTEEENNLIIKYFWSNSLFKSWDENYTDEEERDEAMLQNLISEYSIPREILELGKIKLSRYIHESFSMAKEYFVESMNRKSFAELHQEITNELLDHLIQLSSSIYLQ